MVSLEPGSDIEEDLDRISLSAALRAKAGRGDWIRTSDI
jgi:hypothetical protein